MTGFLNGTFSFLFFSFLNVCFWRERQRAGREGAEREREGEREKESVAGSRLRAVSTEPDTGLELIDCKIMI